MGHPHFSKQHTTTLPIHIHSLPSSGTATPVNHNSSTLPNYIPLAHSPYPPPLHSSNHAYTPRESLELVSRLGVKKSHMSLPKSFLSAISAGMILSFACATLVSTNTAPWYQENAPGLIRTLAALVFPYGLVIVQMTGSDLCTGSFMYTSVACLQGRISLWRMVRHWGVTFWGNLVGSLFVCLVVVGYGGLFDGELYREESLHFAYKKQVTPHWHQIFIRGIGANWLVCMACYLGCSGKDYTSKVVGIWWPTFAFVSLGFDHVVANMFLIPNAIFHGSKDITVGLYIWKGILPALFGNIIGGGVFVGTLYWYLHLQGEDEVEIDGHVYDPSHYTSNTSQNSRQLQWWKRAEHSKFKKDDGTV